MTYCKMKDGIFFHPVFGRIVRKQGMGISIHWSKDMLDYLRRNFPTMLNHELAECLGVSQRTMIRKAREMGLEKDKKWLQGVWDERRHMAHSAARRKGYPGGFKKGQHANPSGEFKRGHKLSMESEERRIASFRRWYRQYPDKASEKARKAWETRRNNNMEVEDIVHEFLKEEIFTCNDCECVVLSDAEECYKLGWENAVYKACEWIERFAYNSIITDNIGEKEKQAIIITFKEAMEEQQ